MLPRSWITFGATNRPQTAPAPTFEWRIPYVQPFAYPPGGGTVCLDTVVYGNDGPNGTNRNFTAYQDAHQLYSDGRTVMPGYRFGAGCSLPTGGAAATATFELRHLPNDMEFDIVSRNGAPSLGFAEGRSALLVGFQAASTPILGIPGCNLLTSSEASMLLPGANDPAGLWVGTFNGFPPLPIGMEFFTQIASGRPGLGVTLSDASRLVMPPLGSTPIAAARVAHGSDPGSATGTVSSTVPVTEFF